MPDTGGVRNAPIGRNSRRMPDSGPASDSPAAALVPFRRTALPAIRAPLAALFPVDTVGVSAVAPVVGSSRAAGAVRAKERDTHGRCGEGVTSP
ncbi:hypothetical protein SGPA1_21940 [Streptomyces misionensis JCM 4497]